MADVEGDGGMSGRLEIKYEQFWPQLGLHIQLKKAWDQTDEDYMQSRKISTKMHNLVARFLFEHPAELEKWDAYNSDWEDWKKATNEKPIPMGHEDTGYYEVLKKACELYGEDYKTIAIKP